MEEKSEFNWREAMNSSAIEVRGTPPKLNGPAPKTTKKVISLLTAMLSLIFLAAFCFSDFPQTNIKSSQIEAKIYLPDIQQGYYRATRFDWSGVIAALEYKGHSYFEQWFEKYDPKLNDAITGPVEEFAPLGYEAAPVGGSFMKIGVGTLLKDVPGPYKFQKTYPVVNPGTRKIEKSPNAVKFIHDLSDSSGFAYSYSKTLTLTKGKPELVLEHTLKNNGLKIIETEVYDHNFFIIDKQPTGPGIVIKFPFNIKAEGVKNGDLAEFKGKEIKYLRALKKNEQVYSSSIVGFGTDPSDYDISIENQSTGAGVRITSDHPLSRIVFWSCSTTSCPEPYIRIKVLPGKEVKWKINYNFYTFKSKI